MAELYLLKGRETWDSLVWSNDQGLDPRLCYIHRSRTSQLSQRMQQK